MWHYLWQVFFMAALLVVSAFLSGSETAFFHLSRRQLHQFSRSSNRLEWLVGSILKTPSRLLTTLLFGNMLVNVSYFALAGVLSVNLNRQWGTAAAGAAAIAGFLSLIVFGELLPKSIAYANTSEFCRLTSLPCYLLLKVFGPPLAVIDFILIRPVSRLFLGPAAYTKDTPPVGTGEFGLLLDSSHKQGLISREENELLMEVLKFGYLKVRHIMSPRVDMITADISTSNADLRRLLEDRNKRIVWIYKGEFDNITGFVTLRDLLINPDKPLTDIRRPVYFVPEQQSVEQFLRFLNNHQTDHAIAVDEYGGIAGSANMNDLIEELLDTADESDPEELIESIGPLTYRLSADLAIHDWVDVFGITPEQSRFSTVGGLVTALLNKIARPGDVIYWKNLKFTVETVRKNRIRTLILKLELNPDERETEN